MFRDIVNYFEINVVECYQKLVQTAVIKKNLQKSIGFLQIQNLI